MTRTTTISLFAVLAFAAVSAPAEARRNVEVHISHNGQALAGAHVCLSLRNDEDVQSRGYQRTNVNGVAMFPELPAGSLTYQLNVTHPSITGTAKTFRVMNNAPGSGSSAPLDPPQVERTSLPGNGGTCVDEEPEPPPVDDPAPAPGPGPRMTAPTPRKTVVVRVRDYGDKPVVGATVCAGVGPGTDSALFGSAQTDSNGEAQIGNVPAGGSGYRRVTISAVKPCGPNRRPVRIHPNGTPIWDCGVGADYAVTSDPNPLAMSLGAADQRSANDSAAAASFICGQTVADPHPLSWRVRVDEEIAPGDSVRAEVRFDQYRGTAWLYDFQWEVSDPRVLDITTSTRGNRRATVRAKKEGSARVTAHLIRTDGRIVSSLGTEITVASPPPPPTAGGDARARAAFQDVESVFHHRRCLNCHTDRPTPRQGERGLRHEPDGRNVYPTIQTRCTDCHASNPPRTRYNAPHAEAFGSQLWRMAPPSMAFEDQGQMGGLKLTKDICAAIKQHYLDAGKCIDSRSCATRVADHIDDDALVKWAFAPGSLMPAHSQGHAHFASKIREWANAGGACPL